MTAVTWPVGIENVDRSKAKYEVVGLDGVALY
jgi:hypothetical protein